jgi:large repetitive protein
MLEPGIDYTARINDEEIIAGGTAGLYTDPSMGPGTPHGSANTQMNGFQFGVNVDETTGPFRVVSGLGGLLFNGTPTGNQSQGIFIGNGDQDNYVQVAVNANGGPGAIEIVHEEDGVILSQSMTPQPGLFSGTVELSFLVDPVAGTAQPGYAIGSGSFINVGSPLTVGGKILDCLRGKTALAVGLLGSTGVGGPTFNATWDYFEVLPVASTASAKLTVNSNSGSLLSSSTNTTGSFQLENTSTGGQKIVEAKVDLRTALLPDIVFDPFGGLPARFFQRQRTGSDR